jgi:hypothetical protein
LAPRTTLDVVTTIEESVTTPEPTETASLARHDSMLATEGRSRSPISTTAASKAARGSDALAGAAISRTSVEMQPRDVCTERRREPPEGPVRASEELERDRSGSRLTNRPF